jgi:hypothetical protein
MKNCLVEGLSEVAALVKDKPLCLQLKQTALAGTP